MKLYYVDILDTIRRGMTDYEDSMIPSVTKVHNVDIYKTYIENSHGLEKQEFTNTDIINNYQKIKFFDSFYFLGDIHHFLVSTYIPPLKLEGGSNNQLYVNENIASDSEINQVLLTYLSQQNYEDISYEIIEGDQDKFSIDNTGKMYILFSPNYEECETYLLKIKVSGKLVNSKYISAAIQDISVEILNINEGPVFDQDSYEYSIPEDNQENQIIARIKILNEEDFGNMTVRITEDGSDSNNFFAEYSSARKDYMIKAKAVFDYQVEDTYNCKIVANNGIEKSADLTINILDVYDEFSIECDEAYSFEVDSGTNALGICAGQINIINPDNIGLHFDIVGISYGSTYHLPIFEVSNEGKIYLCHQPGVSNFWTEDSDIMNPSEDDVKEWSVRIIAVGSNGDSCFADTKIIGYINVVPSSLHVFKGFEEITEPCHIDTIDSSFEFRFNVKKLQSGEYSDYSNFTLIDVYDAYTEITKSGNYIIVKNRNGKKDFQYPGHFTIHTNDLYDDITVNFVVKVISIGKEHVIYVTDSNYKVVADRVIEGKLENYKIIPERHQARFYLKTDKEKLPLLLRKDNDENKYYFEESYLKNTIDVTQNLKDAFFMQAYEHDDQEEYYSYELHASVEYDGYAESPTCLILPYEQARKGQYRRLSLVLDIGIEEFFPITFPIKQYNVTDIHFYIREKSNPEVYYHIAKFSNLKYFKNIFVKQRLKSHNNSNPYTFLGIKENTKIRMYDGTYVQGIKSKIYKLNNNSTWSIPNGFDNSNLFKCLEYLGNLAPVEFYEDDICTPNTDIDINKKIINGKLAFSIFNKKDSNNHRPYSSSVLINVSDGSNKSVDIIIECYIDDEKGQRGPAYSIQWNIYIKETQDNYNKTQDYINISSPLKWDWIQVNAKNRFYIGKDRTGTIEEMTLFQNKYLNFEFSYNIETGNFSYFLNNYFDSQVNTIGVLPILEYEDCSVKIYTGKFAHIDYGNAPYYSLLPMPDFNPNSTDVDIEWATGFPILYDFKQDNQDDAYINYSSITHSSADTFYNRNSISATYDPIICGFPVFKIGNEIVHFNVVDKKSGRLMAVSSSAMSYDAMNLENYTALTDEIIDGYVKGNMFIGYTNDSINFFQNIGDGILNLTNSDSAFVKTVNKTGLAVINNKLRNISGGESLSEKIFKTIKDVIKIEVDNDNNALLLLDDGKVLVMRKIGEMITFKTKYNDVIDIEIIGNKPYFLKNDGFLYKEGDTILDGEVKYNWSGIGDSKTMSDSIYKILRKISCSFSGEIDIEVYKDYEDTPYYSKKNFTSENFRPLNILLTKKLKSFSLVITLKGCKNGKTKIRNIGYGIKTIEAYSTSNKY